MFSKVMGAVSRVHSEAIPKCALLTPPCSTRGGDPARNPEAIPVTP